MPESLAIQAYQQQNLDVNNPENTRFPKHDVFQNGIIENGQPTTFYTAATNADIENIKNRNSQMSGFLSDADTVNSCKDGNGVLDANLYADKTQTQPWRPPDAAPGTDYTYRENVAAFDVNWNTLHDPQNVDLKKRLCDENGNLRCAFGKAEKNTHWGEGGGNQYYINKDDFNEAVNIGVFEYIDNKSLKECEGTLSRQGVSENEMHLIDKERKENINDTLSSCQDKASTNNIEKAKSLNEITPEKANQINSAVATEGNYLAKPDPSFNYTQNSDNGPIQPSNSSSNNRDANLADLGLSGNPQPQINSSNNAQAVSGAMM